MTNPFPITKPEAIAEGIEELYQEQEEGEALDAAREAEAEEWYRWEFEQEYERRFRDYDYDVHHGYGDDDWGDEPLEPPTESMIRAWHGEDSWG